MKREMLTALRLFLFLVIPALLSVPSSYADPADYDPCLITVPQGDSIQAAVDEADVQSASGIPCTIWIGEGTFNENVVIGTTHANLSDLTISGASMKKTVINGSITVKYLSGEGATGDGGITTIKNLGLKGSGTVAYGLHVLGAHVSAENLRASGYQWANVYLEDVGAAHVGRLDLTRSVVEHGRDGVLSRGHNVRMFLLNNTIAYNTNSGVGMIGSTGASPQGIILNNILYHNGVGVHGSTNYNIICSYNAFFENNTHYSITLIDSTNLVDVDPLFVNAAGGNYTPASAASPMVNAGDPESPYDANNTRADIGAFPFTRNGRLVPVSAL